MAPQNRNRLSVVGAALVATALVLLAGRQLHQDRVRYAAAQTAEPTPPAPMPETGLMTRRRGLE